MQFDRRSELKKLNISILVNFLDLLDILFESPGRLKCEEELKLEGPETSICKLLFCWQIVACARHTHDLQWTQYITITRM